MPLLTRSDRRALWAEFRSVILPALAIALVIGLLFKYFPWG